MLIYLQEYEDASGNKTRFHDSQFLVFVNRILAFLMSGLYLLIQRQPQHKTPLYKYAFCSLSNIMSSWCQYEALKYVSFPSQVKIYICICIYTLVTKKINELSDERYIYISLIFLVTNVTFYVPRYEYLYKCVSYPILLKKGSS